MAKRLTAAALVLCLLLTGVAAAEEAGGALVISEVMAAGRLTLFEGRQTDWIELYNGGSAPVDLAGWGLSDNPGRPYKAKLQGSVAPGQYLALAADEAGLGFSLKRAGETVTLTAPGGRVASSLRYEALPPDASYARKGDSWKVTYQPTPGGPNRFAARAETEAARYQGAREYGLYISELMAANALYLPDVLNEDWVELHNPGTKTMTLSGLYLSDDIGDLRKYAFPRGTKLPAGRRAIVYCAGEKIKASGSYTYVNRDFKLDKSGGALILSDGERVIDALSWDTIPGSVSCGRPEGRGGFAWLREASPRQPNPVAGYHQRLPEVRFSREGGPVDAPFTLSLSCQPGAEIRYTLDGSEPGPDSLRYTGPIVIRQSCVVRAAAAGTGWLDGPLATHSYLFDAPSFAPLVCLSGPESTFFGPTGMFSPGFEHFSGEWPVGVEVYQAGASLRQQVGMKLTGGTSQVYLPRAFTLYARSGFDKSRMAVRPFPDRDYQDYDALTLRGGGTDAGRARIRDAFLCSLARGYGLMYLSNQPALVYVNGRFYAAMDIRERANQAAIAQWEGIGDKDVWQRIDIVKNRGIEQQGSKEDLDALASYCRKNDLNDPACLRRVLDWLDVDSLFAHSAFQIICGNSDIGNVRYYRVPGGKWKVMLFDLDLGMLQPGRSPLEHFTGNGRGSTRFFYGELFQALMQVPAMREKFFLLTGRILKERFSPDFLRGRLADWRAQYRPYYERHAQEWPDFTMAKWEKAMDRFETMLMRRPPAVVKYLTSAYKLSDQEVQRYFGGFLASLPGEW